MPQADRLVGKSVESHLNDGNVGVRLVVGSATLGQVVLSCIVEQVAPVVGWSLQIAHL